MILEQQMAFGNARCLILSVVLCHLVPFNIGCHHTVIVSVPHTLLNRLPSIYFEQAQASYTFVCSSSKAVLTLACVQVLTSPECLQDLLSISFLRSLAGAARGTAVAPRSWFVAAHGERRAVGQQEVCGQGARGNAFGPRPGRGRTSTWSCTIGGRRRHLGLARGRGEGPRGYPFGPTLRAWRLRGPALAAKGGTSRQIFAPAHPGLRAGARLDRPRSTGARSLLGVL